MKTAGRLAGDSHERYKPGLPLPLIIAGIVLLAVSVRLYLIFSTRATEEDFYITLRYAWNLAHGAGLVYNPGEHVLGTTTPLYTLLLALFLRFNLDAVLAGKLVSVAADAASCWLVWRLACTFRRPLAGICAALCLALAPLNLTESVKGMESSLVACACIAVWALWAERRLTGAWICAALVTLLRIDGAILAIVLLAACVRRDRKLPLRGLAAYALLTIPWFLIATAVYGSPIPTSLRAKLIVYGWHNHALLPNLAPFLSLMAHNILGMVMLLGLLLAVCLTLWRKSGREPSNLAPMLVWLLLYYGGMAFSKVFLFGWYFLPPTPVYYLAACLGYNWLFALVAGDGVKMRPPGPPTLGGEEPVHAPSCAKRLESGVTGTEARPTSEVDVTGTEARPTIVGAAGRKAVERSAALCLLVSILLSFVIVPHVADVLTQSQRVEMDLRIPIGRWLKEHAAHGDTVMLEPIGYIGWYSGLRVLDTVGLVSPEVLPYYSEREDSPYHAIWVRFLPEWILLRTGELEDLRRREQSLPPAQRLEARYVQANTWRLSGNPPGAPPAFTLFRRIDR